MPDSDIARELRRWLKIVTVLTAILYIALGSVVVYYIVHSSNQRAQLKASQAQLRVDEVHIKSALCATQHELRQRVTSTKGYLRKHPNGIPSLHVSAATLRLQITQAQATLKALSPVDCNN